MARMKRGRLPDLPGFEVVDHPGALVLARKEVVPWVRYVIEGGATLYEAAATDRDGFDLPGRMPVFAVPEKMGRSQRSLGGEGSGSEGDRDDTSAKARWAVRHYSRGGRIFPTLLGDRYLGLGVPRPLHEVSVSEEARSRGVPTPRVMAAALYPSPPFYRGDLVTEFVPNSKDLMGTLFDPRKTGVGGASERLEALKAAGALIRTLQEAGLLHGDLHAGNVLLRWEGTLPRAQALDLDRSRVLPKGRHAPPGPMLNRLTHSLRKWQGRTGLRLTEGEWAALEKAALG